MHHANWAWRCGRSSLASRRAAGQLGGQGDHCWTTWTSAIARLTSRPTGAAIGPRRAHRPRDRALRIGDVRVLCTNRCGPDATVVIFADDETKWTYPSRFVRSVRAQRTGRSRSRPAAGVWTTARSPWTTSKTARKAIRSSSKRIRDRAARFSLREGERRAIDLRLIQR